MGSKTLRLRGVGAALPPESTPTPGLGLRVAGEVVRPGADEPACVRRERERCDGRIVVHKLRRGRRVLNVVYGADAELAGSVFGVPVESDRVELTHDQLERFERHCRRNKLGGVREVREPRGDFDPSDPMLAPLTVPVEVRAEWAKCAALPGIMGMVLCEAWPPGRPVPRTMGIGGYQGLGAMFRLYGAEARFAGTLLGRVCQETGDGAATILFDRESMILVCDAWDRGGGFVLRIGEQFERAMREAVRRAE